MARAAAVESHQNVICRECGIPLVNHPTEDCDGRSEPPDIYVEAWTDYDRWRRDEMVDTRFDDFTGDS